MKKNTDIEIQEALDKNKSVFDSAQFASIEDAELYKILYNKLEHPPEIALAEDFTESVISQAFLRKRKREFLLKIALYTGVSIPMIALSLIIALAMNAEVFWKMLQAVKSNTSLILFGIVLVAVIQFLDKKIVKNKMPDIWAKKSPADTGRTF